MSQKLKEKLDNITDERLMKVIEYVILKTDRMVNLPVDDKGEPIDESGLGEEEEVNEPLIKRRVNVKDETKTKVDAMTSKVKAEGLNARVEDKGDPSATLRNVFVYLTTRKPTESMSPLYKTIKLINDIKLSLLGPSALINRSQAVNISHITEKAYLILMYRYVESVEENINDILSDDSVDARRKASRISLILNKINKEVVERIDDKDIADMYPLLALMLAVSRGSRNSNIGIQSRAKFAFEMLKSSIDQMYETVKRDPSMNVIFSLLKDGIPKDKPKPEGEGEAEGHNEEEAVNEPEVKETISKAEVKDLIDEAFPAPPPQAPPQAQPVAPPQAQPIPQADVGDEAQGNGQLIEQVAAMNEEVVNVEQQQQQQQAALSANNVISQEPQGVRERIRYYLNYMNQFKTDIDNINAPVQVNNNANIDLMNELMMRIYKLFIANGNLIYSSLVNGSIIFENQDKVPYITPDSSFLGYSLTIGDFLRVYDTVAVSFNSKVNGTQKEGLTLPIQELPIYYRVILRNGKSVGLVPENGGVGSDRMNSSMLNIEKNRMVAELLNNGDLTIISQSPRLDIATGQVLMDALGQPLYNTIYSLRGINITDKDLHDLLIGSLKREFLRITGPILSDAEMRVLKSKRNYRMIDENITRKNDVSNINRVPLTATRKLKGKGNDGRPQTSPYNKRAYMMQFIP